MAKSCEMYLMYYQRLIVHPKRETVLAMARESYETVDAWYQRRLRKIKVKRAIRAAVPRPIKKIARKILGR